MATGCCRNRKYIGQILVERGLVTQDQVAEALRLQAGAESGHFIGEILVRMGYVREIDVVTALVVQCDLPYIAVSRHCVDPLVLALIPREFALRERIVPLDRIGNILSVVMQNPLDDEVRQSLETRTGCCIAVFISTRSEIDSALARLYPENG